MYVQNDANVSGGVEAEVSRVPTLVISDMAAANSRTTHLPAQQMVCSDWMSSLLESTVYL